MQATQIKFRDDNGHEGALISTTLNAAIAEELFIYRPLITANKKRILAGELYECINDALIQIQRIPFVYMKDKVSTEIYNSIIHFLKRIITQIRINPTATIHTQFVSI